MNTRILRALLTIAVFAAMSAGTLRQSFAAEIAITISKLPKNNFGGAEVSACLALSGDLDEHVRVQWSLEAFEHRVIKRGESELNLPAREILIPIQFPPVKDGVVLPLRFSASIIIPGEAAPAATCEQKLWLFPESVLAGQQRTLKQQKITLFDPIEATAALLKTAEVPFEETHNVAALAELSEGLILVGEGIDFREYPDLAAALWNRAAAGLNVICLPPKSGAIVLNAEANRATPTNLALRRDDVITEMDSRYDADFWRSAGAAEAATRGMTLHGEGSAVILEASNEATAWPWVELRFGPGPGKLIICGFGICDRWNDGPPPRLLLAHLLTLRLNANASSPATERIENP